MPQPQRSPALLPDVEEPSFTLKDFRGISIRADIVNRPPNSFRRLENFDLYVSGSIRKVQTPGILTTQIRTGYLAIGEYKQTDESARMVVAVGTDGQLYDVDTATAIAPLGYGPLNTPVYLALMPGTRMPNYNYVIWSYNIAAPLNGVTLQYAADGTAYFFRCTQAGFTDPINVPVWPTTLNATVTDHTVIWQNIGAVSNRDYISNYLIIVVPGQQPLKWNGVISGGVTPIGVSAPTVPCYVQGTSAAGSTGYQPVTGRYYAWTFWNPITLHESAPSPVLNVSYLKGFGASTANSYTSVRLNITQASATPKIGVGYTCVRFYATRDGGAQLYLLQTLQNSAGATITDINGAVKFSDMTTGIEPIGLPPYPQTLTNVYSVIDGQPGPSATPDAALVFPSPALTDHYPPPVARWGTIFQGSLVLQDGVSYNSLWPSDPGNFESYSSIGAIGFINENDDDINCIVGGLNLLVVSTKRRVDSLVTSGANPGAAAPTYMKQPIDSLHGFLGHRCVFPLGSKIVGLMRQGFVSFDLNASFGLTSGNIQFGYGDGSLIGDDILPILRSLKFTNHVFLHQIAIDNTDNQLYFMVSDGASNAWCDLILVYSLGATPGWSIMYPPYEALTIRETFQADAVSMWIEIAMASAECAALNSGQWGTASGIFNADPASAILPSKWSNFGAIGAFVPIATAETQAVPVPAMIGGEEPWDVERTFRYFYVEGQDLANFTYQFAVDAPNYVNFQPATPLSMRAGRNVINAHGKQVVLRLIHGVPSSQQYVPPLISLLKVHYTIGGKTS